MSGNEKQRRERSRLRLAKMKIAAWIVPLDAEGILSDLSMSGCAVEIPSKGLAGQWLAEALEEGKAVKFELDLNGELAPAAKFEGAVRVLRDLGDKVVAGFEFVAPSEPALSSVARFIMLADDEEAPSIEFVSGSEDESQGG